MIYFHTNLDKYKTNCFPNDLKIVPRIGEMVSVVDVFRPHFQKQRLPTSLQVKNVTHSERGIFCELWLSEIDAKICKENNVNVFG